MMHTTRHEKDSAARRLNESGFSLVEMIVVMAIFVIVIMITGRAFDAIVSRSASEVKSAESEIEGIVGLEILRRDLVQAGYGLPWDVGTISYQEVKSSIIVTDIDPADFNDAQSSAPHHAPRAIQIGSNAGFSDSDYLVVKSTITGMSGTSKKWYTATFDHISSSQMATNDRLIVLRTTFEQGAMKSRQLVSESASVFSVRYPLFSEDFRPRQIMETYNVYGVAPVDDTTATSLLRMPFNRSDYYIKRPADSKAVPEACAKPENPADVSKGVGILYRSTASQKPSGTGEFAVAQPLLDCVADMQVVLALDTDGDGVIDSHSDTHPVPLGAPTATNLAQTIRNQVREVRVYILAQDGRKVPGFTYPHQEILVGEVINGITYGKLFDLDSMNIKDSRNYRWRVYSFTAQTANLN